MSRGATTLIRKCQVLWTLDQGARHYMQHPRLQSLSAGTVSALHTSSCSHGLMEFFDDDKNWGEESVKVGRSWRMDELRLKSNSDLHKLWYILLKERNMLMSMEHECLEQYELFPNPERLDKVKESMHNLEEVVIERNKAFHELETGETGLRPAKELTNHIGLQYFRRMTEHLVPKYVNTKYWEKHPERDNYSETKNFLALLGEKKDRFRRRNLKGVKNHILGLMRRFPNLDLEAVSNKFPEFSVEELQKMSRTDEARGPWLP